MAQIDGVGWKNCGAPQYPNITAQYFYGAYFDIDGIAYCQNGDPGIYIKVFGLHDTGTYILNGFNYAKFSSNKEYITDNSHTGILQVTEFDISSRKISGYFNFQAIDTATGSVVKVDSGLINKVTFYKF